jgi:peptidoglycan/xylan/chitin deacetylase (PgdA/CDA1 family)
VKLATSVWQKVERRLSRFCERRTVKLMYDKGVVCFTFDDVRRSACVEGAAILDRYAVKGTFYISGGKTGISSYHTAWDLLRLANRGHELGSHGFGHHSYQSIGKAEILADVEDNRSFFAKLGCDTQENFAYPYGHVSPSVKRITSCEFASLRGIQPGINYPTVDLALLKSFPLYRHLWTETTLARVLEENARLRGLVIFFTHGILADPGEFDCSTELFDFAVRTSITSGNRIASVRDALPRRAQ